MHFPFSHQIPLSKFGVPTWPQADTISLCGIFPAFPCITVAKLVTLAVSEPALQKRQLCSLIESRSTALLPALLRQRPFQDSGAASNPSSPLHWLMMWALRKAQNPLKDLRKEGGKIMHILPLSVSGTPFLFSSSPRPYHSFIHVINTHYKLPIMAQARGWRKQAKQDGLLFLQGQNKGNRYEIIITINQSTDPYPKSLRPVEFQNSEMFRT